jgi:broad specificity phosphatase PhoE
VPTVLLIRHGQASFGAADYDVLSGTGERQAEIAAALAGPAPEVDPRWDGYDANDVLTHHSDSAARLDGTAAPLAGELGRGEIAVVATSGGTIAALAGGLLGAPALTFPALNRVMVNASVTKVTIGAGGVNLIGFNDHSHLEEVDRQLVTYR